MTTAWIAYIPSPPRGVWYLGALPIRAYALFIITGIIVALLISDRRYLARGGERGVVYDIALWMVPFGLIGGRLYHLATDWKTYFGDGGVGPVAALRIWDGGLGIWGAVTLGAVGAWIGCRRRGIPLPAFLDAVAPAVVLAQAIGRLGNYFNQELYGRETTMPWGLEIFYRRDPAGFVDVHSLDGVSTGQVAFVVQPTFLYELIWNVLVFLALLYIDRRFSMGHGRLFALYVALYCVGRFWVELLRDDAATLIAGIRINSFTSTFVFIGAVVYVILAPKGREDPATVCGSDYLAGETPELEPSEELAAVAPAAGTVGAAASATGEKGEPDTSAETLQSTEVVEPETERAEVAQPETVTPEVAEPPGEGEPEAIEPEAEEAASAGLEVAEPEATEPEVVEPEGEAEAAEPEVEEAGGQAVSAEDASETEEAEESGAIEPVAAEPEVVEAEESEGEAEVEGAAAPAPEAAEPEGEAEAAEPEIEEAGGEAVRAEDASETEEAEESGAIEPEAAEPEVAEAEEAEGEAEVEGAAAPAPEAAEPKAEESGAIEPEAAEPEVAEVEEPEGEAEAGEAEAVEPAAAEPDAAATEVARPHTDEASRESDGGAEEEQPESEAAKEAPAETAVTVAEAEPDAPVAADVEPAESATEEAAEQKSAAGADKEATPSPVSDAAEESVGSTRQRWRFRLRNRRNRSAR